MIVPPSSSDWASRMDTTKLKARTFNTGKTAREGGSGSKDSSTWTESPSQRAERERNEALGVFTQSGDHTKVPEAKATIKGSDDRKSLREEFTETNKKRIRDEDPRNRTFDYERDIASGTKMATQTKKQLLDKGSSLNSSFSGGSYL